MGCHFDFRFPAFQWRHEMGYIRREKLVRVMSMILSSESGTPSGVLASEKWRMESPNAVASVEKPSIASVAPPISRLLLLYDVPNAPIRWHPRFPIRKSVCGSGGFQTALCSGEAWHPTHEGLRVSLPAYPYRWLDLRSLLRGYPWHKSLHRGVSVRFWLATKNSVFRPSHALLKTI